MFSEPKPTRLSTLCRISPAALFVNVMARMFHGFTPCSSIRYAIRWVSTLVLPEPAPARMRSGPSVWKTASFCGLFNVSYMLIRISLKSYNPINYSHLSHFDSCLLSNIFSSKSTLFSLSQKPALSLLSFPAILPLPSGFCYYIMNTLR